MFKQQQRSKYQKMTLVVLTEKHEMSPPIKACVYLFGLYVNSKNHQGAFISAVFIPNINSVSFSFSPFAQDHVNLMLSDFVLFSALGGRFGELARHAHFSPSIYYLSVI